MQTRGHRPSRRAITAALGALVPAALAVTVTGSAGTAWATPASTATASTAAPAAVSGTLERGYIDPPQQTGAPTRADTSVLVTWIVPSTGGPVRVPTSALETVPTGTTVAVSLGAPVSDPAAAAGQEPARQVLNYHVLAAASPAPTSTPTGVTTTTTGVPATDIVDIVMALPPGATKDSMTLDKLVTAVNGPVSQYWATQSNGAFQYAVGQAVEWTPTSHDCSTPGMLWSDVEQTIGFTEGPGKHLLVYLPYSTPGGCSGGGLGTLGWSGANHQGLVYVQTPDWPTIAHELGHNMGLMHSGSLICQQQTEAGLCKTDDYGDQYNVMGNPYGAAGSLNASQAVALGFLPPSQVQAVASATGSTSSTASYSLAPLSGTTGIRTIRLTAPTGEVYYLEYRSASGQDSFLGSTDSAVNPQYLQPGVLIHRVQTPNGASAFSNSGGSDETMLLDASPTSDFAYWQPDRDPTFAVGKPVQVSENAFTVTVTATSATVATVKITANPAPKNVLFAKSALTAPQSLTSPSGQYRLVMQSDGNLVEYGPDGKARWASGTSGAPGARVTMQSDGNLVVYGADGKARWASGTNPLNAAHLVLADDGTLTMVDWTGTICWRNGTAVTDSLWSNSTLRAGKSLTSPNSVYRLTLQSDGNLVEYTADGRVLWASGTKGTGASLVAQDDGNYVLYDATGKVLWAAGTDGFWDGRLVINDDGSLAIYDFTYWSAWSTNPDPTTSLPAGQQAAAGRSFTSLNGVYRVTMQSDGNFVLYQGSKALWSTNTSKAPGAALHMQRDGNLVLYGTTGAVLWATGTEGNWGARLTVTNTVAVTVVSSTGALLWSSH